jgi:hypothetical protein
MRAMNDIAQRNRLLPWYIGLAIIIASAFYVGYEMYAQGCAIASPLVILVLVIMPAVYAVLMYLTFTSQK